MTTGPPTAEGGATATRREFLTGDWFEAEATTNGETAKTEPADDDTESESDVTSTKMTTDRAESTWSHRLEARLGQLLGTAAVLVLVLVVVSSAVTPAVAATTSEDESARAATEAREDALALLAELEEVDETESVDVDRAVFSSVLDHIEQGNISFRNGEYGTAVDNYERASQQARAALESAYVERAEFLLNASQAQLSALNRQGYATVRHQQLESRAAELSRQLESVSGVREARQLEQDSVALSNDVEALPDTDLVRTVHYLHDGWPLVAVGLLLSTVGLLAIGAWIRPRVESLVGVDDRDREQVTTQVGAQAGYENYDDH
ncbi:hypothetical protein ACOJIV_18255 [Haloarcula sp. AONF1]